MTPTEIFQVISTIGGVVGLAVGTPGIVLFLLNRRNANQKLRIDENKLTVEQFNAALPAYRDLLDRANKATKDALAELASYKEERVKFQQDLATSKEERITFQQDLADLRDAKGQQDEELNKTNDKLEKLRSLVQNYVTRTGVQMTTEELAIFEDTKPITRRRRAPKNPIVHETQETN